MHFGELERLFYRTLLIKKKKEHFGESLNTLNGYEYYVGGIFEENPTYFFQTRITPDNSHYVDSFDWRNRHGADNPSSPYYNAGGIGWLTSVKNQGKCGSCWAFSAVGAIEAVTNLYFNQFLNLDLSEQQLVSCYNKSCLGGWPSNALDYIMKNDGIIDESSFPYTEVNTCEKCSIVTTCDKFPQSYKEKINISGVEALNDHTSDELKYRIINYGPLAGVIMDTQRNIKHAMTLVGYMTLRAGDIINLESYKSNPTITISSNDPRIGHTVWIFKQSYANSNVVDFFYYLPDNLSAMKTSVSLLTPIESVNYDAKDIPCEDKDGDGYYYWGIGPKPAHCPSCPDEPDADDSDPNIGPMNQYGHTSPILKGDTLVCPDLAYTYTYIIPFPAKEDTYIPVKLHSKYNVQLSSEHIFIRKGDVSGNVSVVWSKYVNNNVLYIGDIKRKIKVYAKSELLPSIKSYPEIKKLKPDYPSSDTLYWLIPARLTGNVNLVASDAMAMTETFLWEVESNGVKDIKYGNTYQLDYFNSHALSQIVVKVTPFRSIACSSTKTIIIKRSNLKLTTTERYACDGDLVRYTIEGFDDLANTKCAFVEWRAEGCVAESEVNCDGNEMSSCIFTARGNGYGKVKVTIIPQAELDGGGCMLYDRLESAPYEIHLESDKIWVGPNNLEFTEIDEMHIIKDDDRPNVYYFVPQTENVEKWLWSVNYSKNGGACFLYSGKYYSEVYFPYPEGREIEITYNSASKCDKTYSTRQTFRFTDPDAKNLTIISNLPSDTIRGGRNGDVVTFTLENIPEVYDVNWSWSDNLYPHPMSITKGKSKTFHAINTGEAYVSASNIMLQTYGDDPQSSNGFHTRPLWIYIKAPSKTKSVVDDGIVLEAESLVKIDIYSLTGVLVYSGRMNETFSYQNLNLLSGVYIVKIMHSSGIIETNRILIK